MATPRILSEECSVAINHVASYELHISDAYLSMACYYIEDPKEPCFAAFFHDQAEVKREHGKQFLAYLRRYQNKIILPVIKRPEIDNWETGIKALDCALEMEKQLRDLLLDLKIKASVNNEYDLLCFMGTYLDKQKQNIKYLQRQLAYHKELVKKAQEEEEPLEKPAEVR